MTPDRPNILFIFTDQQQRDTLGCMDNPDIRTPNLDALAASGVLFRQAYTCCPICTAARINFFTGRYASQTNTIGNGARIPAGLPTFAGAFNAAGYRSAFVGKWHIGGNGNGPVPRDLLGDFQAFNGYQCYNGFLHEIRFHDQDGNERVFDRHRTEVTTDLAIEQLDAMGDDPFVLAVAYQAPHYPVEPAHEYAAMYEGLPPRPRPNAREDVEPYTRTFSPRSPKPRENDPNYQRYGGNMAEYRRLYYALVSQVDANVGRLLAQLESRGLADRTVVIFTSDHGDMQGSHGLVNKCLPYEESAGIPLVCRVPGGCRGLVTDALVSGVDYLPTCLDLAGIAVPPTVAGRSFAPLLRGREQVLDGPVFSEFRDWRMIRQGPWKLVCEGEDNRPTQLYNLAEDPGELDNRIAASATTPLVHDLRQTLIEGIKDKG